MCEKAEKNMGGNWRRNNTNLFRDGRIDVSQVYKRKKKKKKLFFSTLPSPIAFLSRFIDRLLIEKNPLVYHI